MSKEPVREPQTDRQRQVFDAVEEGLQTTEIAALLGISYQRVGQICKSLNIRPIDRAGKSKMMMEEAGRLHNSGQPIEDIANAIGCSLSTAKTKVYDFLRSVGVAQSQIVAERREKVSKLINDGFSRNEIAKMVNVQRNVVQQDTEGLGLSISREDIFARTKERQAQAQLLKVAGLTLEQIAENLEISKQQAWNYLNESKINDDILSKVHDLVKKGFPGRRIEVELGISHQRVINAIRQLKDRKLIAPGRRKTVKNPDGKSVISPSKPNHPLSIKGDVACPNSECINHADPMSGFYRKKGKLVRKSGATVQRYQCKFCGTYFNAMLTRAERGQRRPELNSLIVKLKSKGMSQRKIAAVVGCNKVTVGKKLKEFAVSKDDQSAKLGNN
ncbi:hypothetical protein [Novilysobacter arseniciresistens]|uniref:hypothetical protein n=1 Tax=Novilysobacter arseniciresistens TaxID=1385522 RepID=UPI00126A15AB|nr:hypothetical protein [Lysobacter arseniciresistens]